MRNVENITITRFPKQSLWLNMRCKVIFHYSSEHETRGLIVRDDGEEPFETIIRLDDGNYVRSTECQYSPLI